MSSVFIIPLILVLFGTLLLMQEQRMQQRISSLEECVGEIVILTRADNKEPDTSPTIAEIISGHVNSSGELIHPCIQYRDMIPDWQK